MRSHFLKYEHIFWHCVVHKKSLQLLFLSFSQPWSTYSITQPESSLAILDMSGQINQKNFFLNTVHYKSIFNVLQKLCSLFTAVQTYKSKLRNLFPRNLMSTFRKNSRSPKKVIDNALDCVVVTQY